MRAEFYRDLPLGILCIVASFVAAGIAFRSTTADAVSCHDPTSLADVNGSGSRDILWGDGCRYRYLDLTGGLQPRLLVRVENGFCGVTEVSNEPSTAQYLRARDEGQEWQTTCPFPIIESATRPGENDLGF